MNERRASFIKGPKWPTCGVWSMSGGQRQGDETGTTADDPLTLPIIQIFASSALCCSDCVCEPILKKIDPSTFDSINLTLIELIFKSFYTVG